MGLFGPKGGAQGGAQGSPTKGLYKQRRGGRLNSRRLLFTVTVHPLLLALLMAIRLTSRVYAKPLPIQRSSCLHDSEVRRDDTPTRSLIVTRWISPFLAQPHRHEHTIWQITQKCHPSRLNLSFENVTFFPSHTLTHFPFIKQVVLCLRS